MTIDLTQIILAIITLLGAIITKYLIPFLKAKYAEQASKMSEDQIGLIRLVASIVVSAAEQLYHSDECTQKKEYAMQKGKEMLAKYGLEIDDELLSTTIEAIVLELHAELKE